jgi:hypothetical protein
MCVVDLIVPPVDAANDTVGASLYQLALDNAATPFRNAGTGNLCEDTDAGRAHSSRGSTMICLFITKWSFINNKVEINGAAVRTLNAHALP